MDICSTLDAGVYMRKKVKGRLYYLARDAKIRMRNYNKTKSVFEQIPYAKSCLGEKDQELYNRVCKILDSNEIIINPIQELVDKKYYNSLSLESKQKYIIDLTERYKVLKTRYLREHNSNTHSNVI